MAFDLIVLVVNDVKSGQLIMVGNGSERDVTGMFTNNNRQFTMIGSNLQQPPVS